MSAGLLLHTPLPPKKYLFYRYDMSKMGFNVRLLCNHLYDSPNGFESFFSPIRRDDILGQSL